MNDSTPKRKSPRKETLDFIKKFARMYQPDKISCETEVGLNELRSAVSAGLC